MNAEGYLSDPVAINRQPVVTPVTFSSYPQSSMPHGLHASGSRAKEAIAVVMEVSP